MGSTATWPVDAVGSAFCSPAGAGVDGSGTDSGLGTDDSVVALDAVDELEDEDARGAVVAVDEVVWSVVAERAFRFRRA